MVVPIILPQNIVKPFYGRVLIHTGSPMRVFKIISEPYEHQDTFYCNVIDIGNTEEFSISLDDLHLCERVGKLPILFNTI